MGSGGKGWARTALLVALGVAAVAGVDGAIPEGELRAWQALYDATGGSGWTRCSDKRDDPCSCSYSGNYGVTCDGGHITEIVMYSNGLTGESFGRTSSSPGLASRSSSSVEQVPSPPSWAT